MKDNRNKPYKHDSNYLIYYDGRIYSKYINRFIGHKKLNGYRFVTLNGKNHPVHRVILYTWGPIKGMEKLYVNHINMNKTDNHVDNLEWVTSRANIDHRTECRFTGKFTSYYNPKRKLSDEDYEDIYRLKERKPHLSGQDLSRIFKISKSHANGIIRGSVKGNHKYWSKISKS